MTHRLFGTNGIRGIFNKELTPEFTTELGLAIGSYFTDSKIVVGYDSRTSSFLLSRAVISGLLSLANAGLMRRWPGSMPLST